MTFRLCSILLVLISMQKYYWWSQESVCTPFLCLFCRRHQLEIARFMLLFGSFLSVAGLWVCLLLPTLSFCLKMLHPDVSVWKYFALSCDASFSSVNFQLTLAWLIWSLLNDWLVSLLNIGFDVDRFHTNLDVGTCQWNSLRLLPFSYSHVEFHCCKWNINVKTWQS